MARRQNLEVSATVGGRYGCSQTSSMASTVAGSKRRQDRRTPRNSLLHWTGTYCVGLRGCGSVQRDGGALDALRNPAAASPEAKPCRQNCCAWMRNLLKLKCCVMRHISCAWRKPTGRER